MMAEAGKDEGSLGYREGRTHLVVGTQLLVGLHHLSGAEVYAT